MGRTTRSLLAPLLAILAMGAAADAARADLKNAISTYKAGKYTAALKEFTSLAKAGDAIAQYNVGVMYLTGRGVAKDPALAARWHRSAAEQGLAVAQYGLGVMYYMGEGVDQDHEAAATWFRKAANQDYADAQFNLGVMHFNGQGVRRDMSEVVKWISLAAAQGHKDAMFRMAMMYEEGDPFRGDRDEALRWYRRAAAKGHDTARARVALLGGAETAANGVAPPGNQLAPTPAPPTNSATATPAPPIPTTAIDEKERPARAAPAKPPVPRARVARAAPKPAPAPRKKTIGAPSRAWAVQLASFRSVDEAKRAWARLKKQHSGALGGLAPTYGRVNLGNKGVYHRLRVGPLANRAAAKVLCAGIKKQAPDQGCLAVPPQR